MENPIRSFPASPQTNAQGYNSHSQLQNPAWNGSPVRQNGQVQNPNVEAYPSSMNRYYQGTYIPHQNSTDATQYAHNVPSSQQAYNAQYQGSRQAGYPNTSLQQQQPYPAALKSNYNVPYYGNISHQSISSTSNDPNMRQSNYPGAPYYPSKAATQCTNPLQVPPNSNTAQTQMPYVKQQGTAYARYASGYTPYQNDNQMGYPGKQAPSSATVTSSSTVVPMAQTNGQLSSIPTPPETSGPGDIPCNDNSVVDGNMECNKMNHMSRSSFVLPGTNAIQSSMSFSSSSSNANFVTNMTNGSSEISRGQNWSNGPVALQPPPPPNVDEGSQASSASASSSIPEEQNSVKMNSKPNFSYPPTPNTLSSPGAASMSSFHDDLECISSPGWPRTPASPVAPNASNYEFANIKRPESLLKLYTLSDEPDRRYFLDKLIVFNEDRGSPITQCPTISKQPLDVFRVYLAVKERGGFVDVTNAKRWKDIAGAIGVGASSSAAYTLRKQYMKLLLPFECKYDRGGIDPQPIINQVEASSRKKGKNSTSGNSNMCLQGYPQSVDGYPPGYQDSYPPSRYNPNSMDYRYSSNSSQYSPSVHHNAAVSSQQYGQYSQSTQSMYNYYQGGAYNNTGTTSQSPSNNNLCRYPSNNASATNVNNHNSNYYNTNYAVQQNYSSTANHMYNDSVVYNGGSNSNSSNSNSSNSNMNNEEEATVSIHPNPAVMKAMQPNNFDAYQDKSAVANKMNTDDSDEVSIIKPDDSVDSMNDPSKSSESKPNDTSYTNTYATPLSTQQETPSATPQSYPMSKPTQMNAQWQYQPSSMNSNKCYQPNCQTTAGTPSHGSNGVVNQTNSTPSYSNSPSYQNTYQAKVQSQPMQFGRYANSPNSYSAPEIPSSYQCPSPMKYNCSNGPKEIANGHLSTAYPGDTQQHPAKNMYSNFNVYPSSNKEHYQMNCHKDAYGNKAIKGWGSTSYPYQSSESMTPSPSPNGSPEKILYREASVPYGSPEASQGVRKPSSTSSGSSHYTNKMQHQLPHNLIQSMKKHIVFPEGSLEALKPVYHKRRRYSAKRVSPLDPWKMMMALKSGLLAESTWALDTLSVLLCDNSSAVYFRLSHLPGLLSALVEYYRRYLNKIYDLVTNTEINIAAKDKEDASSAQNNKKTSSFNWHKKAKILDSPNYTFQTRCKKSVNIQHDEALFLIDPEQKWDKHEGFNVTANHWLMGCGEITDHIQIPFTAESSKVQFARDMDKEMGKNKPSSDGSTKDGFFDLTATHPPLSCIGDPIIIIKKCDILRKALSKSKEKFNSDTENSRTSNEIEGEDSLSKSIDSEQKVSANSNENDSLSFSGVHLKIEKTTPDEISCEANIPEISEKAEPCKEPKVEDSKPEASENMTAPDSEIKENVFPRLRCETPQKRLHRADLEDEAYTPDHPALNLSTDYEESLIRHCICVSNILRNLSFIPGNDVEMNKNSSLLLILGRLLLLQHEHKPVKSFKKYDRELENGLTADDSCVSLTDYSEWKANLLHVLRDNTLVILSNISGQMDLTPYPEEISLPILDGLLHWVTCPSSYARDSLPTKPSLSVLTPQRLSLEALCKLSILDNNVDLMVATPPWSRIECLFELLAKFLGPAEDKVVREFSIVLLSSLSQADSSVARAIANQTNCISYLIGFIEQTEASAFQIAITQGSRRLKDNPEIVGTTPDMILRVANILKCLAQVPENRSLFFRHQQRLLTLVTSQIMDQELASVIADVLYYCSDDCMHEGMSLVTSQYS